MHDIDPGQFPPGVVDLLQYDNGLIWSAGLIDHLWRNHSEPMDYPGALSDLLPAIRLLNPHSALTVGSMSPWIESSLDCPTTVTDVRPIRIDSQRITYATPGVAYAKQYDVVVSYSSVEHFGLGRYGDMVDMDADKKWMTQIRECIAPGGSLLLAVPLAPAGKIERCYHRLYGPLELRELIAGYKIVSCTRDGRQFSEPPHEKIQGQQDWQNQPLLTLVPA